MADKKESIDLTALAYGWGCPVCEESNSISQIPTDANADKKESIDLTALAYGWDCPVCEESNSVSKIPTDANSIAIGDVQCDGCLKLFAVNQYYHDFE